MSVHVLLWESLRFIQCWMRRLFISCITVKHITSLTLPSFRQLHSNFRDFSNEVCHVTKSTMAEYCPGQSITCVDTSQWGVSPETPVRHRDEGSLLSWRLGASCRECPQKPQSGKEMAFACGYGELVDDVGSVPRNTSRAKRDPDQSHQLILSFTEESRLG